MLGIKQVSHERFGRCCATGQLMDDAVSDFLNRRKSKCRRDNTISQFLEAW